MASLPPIPQITIDDHFNPVHPFIAKYYANVNLDAGREYWDFRRWTPPFGHIQRYSLTEWLGSGRYADVYKGLQDNENVVAIKVLKPVNCDRIRREFKILTIVKGHPCILEIIDMIIDPVNSICSLVMGFGQNKSWRKLFGKMHLDDIRFYIYRILQALEYTHSRGIMHRDVKPLNVLCENPRESVILADWGLAEFYHPMRKYSRHVCTRYYKAPELLFEFGYYNYTLDIWSLGVTLLECLCGKIHVFDAKDNDHQIEAICEVIGGQSVINWARMYTIQIPTSQEQKLRRMQGTGIRSLFSITRQSFLDPDALDILDKMLTVDHRQRISAADALQHPFFQLVRDYDESHGTLTI